MKKIIFPMFVLSALFFSCSNSNTGAQVEDAVNATAGEAGTTVDDHKGKTGTFSFDGMKVSAEVTTQYFGDKEKGNFSVLCQHNESSDLSNPNFELLQVTFVNEKDATSNSSLKIYQGGSSLPVTEPEPGIVAVSLSGVGNGLTNKEFTGSEKSNGSITVKNRTIEVKELSLFTRDGDKKVINARLPF